jgi:uncharacterized protein Yka (UPF0111/DUF47 family)
MVGQEKNTNMLVNWRLKKSVPRFILIEGEEGSGRLTLAKSIIKILNATGVIVGNSIDDVRKTIENAYNVQSTTVYIFRNADDMSLNAKNSLLKVVEEPPNKAYFIMTLKSIDGTLDTIKSRGTLIKMQPYTKEQLKTFTSDDLVIKYCNTPGKCKNLDRMQILTAETTVNEVIDGLVSKSGTKILKACTKLKSKEAETDKLDCSLFLSVFENLIESNISSLYIYLECLTHIEKCKRELTSKSINKKASIECMLIKILEVFKSAEISKKMD